MFIIIVACLGCATIGWAQSNTVTVTVPAGSTITLPPAPPTNVVSIMPPPPSPASDALVAAAFMNMRRNRMENPAWLGTQAFEVLEVEEVSQPEADMDERGLPTGTFTPMTNYVVTLKPNGTNAPLVRGASKDGATILIFSKPVPKGITIDVNIRQSP